MSGGPDWQSGAKRPDHRQQTDAERVSRSHCRHACPIRDNSRMDIGDCKKIAWRIQRLPSSLSPNHVDRCAEQNRQRWGPYLRPIAGRLLGGQHDAKRPLVDGHLLDSGQLFVPGFRSTAAIGGAVKHELKRWFAVKPPLETTAAFSFLEVNHASGKLSAAPRTGSVHPSGKGDCPVKQFGPCAASQVRVLSLPHIEYPTPPPMNCEGPGSF